MKAYIFPGQGSQFTGMCHDLFLKYDTIKPLFTKAEEILEFDISKIMFEGSKEELTQTKVTQPAIFIHSMAILKILGRSFQPDFVAGHSLGEFSALVASGVLSCTFSSAERAWNRQIPAVPRRVVRASSVGQAKDVCAGRGHHGAQSKPVG